MNARGIITKILQDFSLQDMTIWLCDRDSSCFIMFRQVEVIKQRPANGSGASARRGYVHPIQSISSPCRYVRRYVFTGLIALGYAKKLDPFLLAIPWKTLALFWYAINPHSSSLAFEKYCRNWRAMMQKLDNYQYELRRTTVIAYFDFFPFKKNFFILLYHSNLC